MHVTMFDPGNFTPHYVENLSNALMDLGVRVDIITSAPLFEDAGSNRSVHVENHFFKLAGRTGQHFLRRHGALRRFLKAVSYPLGLWRTWRAMQGETPGILHVQWALFPWLDAILFRKLRSKGWLIVYTAHDVVTELDGPLTRWMFRQVYRTSDAVMVHTPGLAGTLRDDCGDVLARVCAIPEGISTFPLSPEVDRGRARGVLGLRSLGPVLLFFGMIKRYKGLEHLLRAWPLVLKEFPDAQLLIAGEGMVSLRPFKRLLESLKITNSVELRPGYVSRLEAQYFFCAADAVVLPHVKISTSGVVPLAYRYARPVIATTAGAMPEIVRDGETGFLAPPGDEHSLAEAICRGFRNPEVLANMGVWARDWFERDRNWREVARQTIALYSSLNSTQPGADGPPGRKQTAGCH